MKALPPSLYQITSELGELEKLLEDDNGVNLDPNIMNILVLQIQSKTDSVVGFVNYMEDQVASIDARLKELADYKKGVLTKLDKLDHYVASCLKQLGTTKLEGQLSTIARRAPTDVVVILNENDIPMEFLQTTVAPKKMDIKNAIKSGKEVPGAKMEKSQNVSMIYKNRKALSKKEAEVENE